MTLEEITTAQAMTKECLLSDYKNCGSQIVYNLSKADDCQGFVSVWGYAAEGRDNGRSQDSILKDVLDKTKMKKLYAKQVIEHIYTDSKFKTWDPNTIEDISLKYCMDDPSVLTKAMK